MIHAQDHMMHAQDHMIHAQDHMMHAQDHMIHAQDHMIHAQQRGTSEYKNYTTNYTIRSNKFQHDTCSAKSLGKPQTTLSNMMHAQQTWEYRKTVQTTL